MTKMPEVIEFVANRILEDKKLYEELKNIFKLIISKLHNSSLSNSSFCNTLATNNNIANILLKRFMIFSTQLVQQAILLKWGM